MWFFVFHIKLSFAYTQAPTRQRKDLNRCVEAVGCVGFSAFFLLLFTFIPIIRYCYLMPLLLAASEVVVVAGFANWMDVSYRTPLSVARWLYLGSCSSDGRAKNDREWCADERRLTTNLLDRHGVAVWCTSNAENSGYRSQSIRTPFTRLGSSCGERPFQHVYLLHVTLTNINALPRSTPNRHFWTLFQQAVRAYNVSVCYYVRYASRWLLLLGYS